MEGIIKIEKPLHPFPAASLPVILGEDRDRQESKELQNAVEAVEKEKINGGVNEGPENDIAGLPAEVSPVEEKEERTHNGDRRPVGRESDQAYRENDKRFSPPRKPRPGAERDQNDRPRKRPHDARLVEDPRQKWEKRDPEGEIVSKMRDQGKKEESADISPHVMGIVAPLRDKKPHDRRCQPADDMQKKDVPNRLRPGKKDPRQVVDRHRDDRDQFDLISVQSFFFHY